MFLETCIDDGCLVRDNGICRNWKKTMRISSLIDLPAGTDHPARRRYIEAETARFRAGSAPKTVTAQDLVRDHPEGPAHVRPASSLAPRTRIRPPTITPAHSGASEICFKRWMPRMNRGLKFRLSGRLRRPARTRSTFLDSTASRLATRFVRPERGASDERASTFESTPFRRIHARFGGCRAREGRRRTRVGRCRTGQPTKFYSERRGTSPGSQSPTGG